MDEVMAENEKGASFEWNGRKTPNWPRADNGSKNAKEDGLNVFASKDPAELNYSPSSPLFVSVRNFKILESLYFTVCPRRFSPGR